MKIDIRDEEAVQEIIFADSVICGELYEQTIGLHCDDCVFLSSPMGQSSATITNEDIPNLIKALQKVCELKGIK
jgi:hypothetical protein